MGEVAQNDMIIAIVVVCLSEGDKQGIEGIAGDQFYDIKNFFSVGVEAAVSLFNQLIEFGGFFLGERDAFGKGLFLLAEIIDTTFRPYFLQPFLRVVYAVDCAISLFFR